MYTSHPNVTLGYAAKDGVSTGRWDDAYMTEDETGGGHIAFGTGTPTAGPGASVLRSQDGLAWAPAAPALAHFSEANVVATPFEVGGVEKMADGRYYMLIGSPGPRDAQDSYSMWTLRTNGTDIAGPYLPDPKAYRLSGQSQRAWKGIEGRAFQELADWVRDYDKPWGGHALVSQYIAMPKTADAPPGAISGQGHVYLLPFRQPVLDAEGHLRLGHWSGNEALKGAQLPMAQRQLPGLSGAGHANFSWFAGSDAWDHSVGVMMTGALHAPASAGSEIGFALRVGANDTSVATSIMMEVKADHDESRSTRVHDHSRCSNVAGVWDSAGHPVIITQTGCAVQASNSDGNFTGWSKPSGTTIDFPTNSVTINFHPSGPHPGPVLTGLIQGTADNLTIAWVHDGSSAKSFWFRRKIGQPQGEPTAELLRDTTGPFECGARSSLTCLPATTTGVPPGSVTPFLLYARHGIFELYIGEPLLLVQTTTYGVYPVARAALGLAIKNGSAHIGDAKAWQLSLNRTQLGGSDMRHSSAHKTDDASGSPNVLFIAVDDMRPSIGAYNFSLAHTPNMDRLAAEGVTFARHFVQYACVSPTAAFLRERSFAPRPTE